MGKGTRQVYLAKNKRKPKLPLSWVASRGEVPTGQFMHIKRSFQSEEELKGTLDYIYGKSKEGKCFNGILEAAFNEVTIITAIHKIKSNKGANTPSVDGQKMRKYLQMSKEKLIQLIQTSVKDYK